MPTFRQFVDSLIAVWTEATPAARAGLVLLTLTSIVGVGFVGYWSAQPSYVALITDVDSEKMSKVINELEKMGIQYELAGAGGVLKVDQRNLARAKMAANQIGVQTDASKTATGTGGMWLDPTERRNLEIRQKELVLETTISNYAAVDNSDVHLNVPVRGPFERKVVKPTASVQLTLRPGQRLSDENVLAIATAVAYAIENLEPEWVNITDTDGNVYPVADISNGHVHSQVEFTNQQERTLARKAESQLNKIFGFGNSSVQVSLDYTFVEKSRQVTDYVSEGKVALSENIETTSSKGGAAVPVGPAGTASNLNTTSAQDADSSSESKTERLENSYVVPTTESREVNNTPTRNYMTVSVLVNEQAPGVLAEDGTRTTDIQARVENIVKTAVGFQTTSDQITVDFAPFPVLEETELVATPFDWNQLNGVLRNISLAIAALVALVIGFLTFRHFKSTNISTNALPADDSKVSLNQLNDLLQNNPEVFVKIIKAWGGDRAKPSGDQDNTNDTSAAA